MYKRHAPRSAIPCRPGSGAGRTTSCARPARVPPTSRMPSLALRPRSPSELVDAAFQVLRAHYPQFVMCSAIAYLPWLITDIVRASDPASLAIPDLGRTLLLGLVMWLSFAVMNSVLIACAAQAYLGDPIHVASAVRKAVVRAPAVLVGATLRFLLIGFAFLFL